MKDKVSKIIQIAKEYTDDWEYWKEQFESLNVEGMGETYYNTLYGGVKDLLEGKLEKQIEEILGRD